MAVVTYGDYLQFIGETILTNEPQVKQALVAAEDYANKYCNRTFAKYDSEDAAATTLEETFSGKGGRKYYPLQAPIVSVTKVEYWNTDDWTQFDTGTHTPIATTDRVTFQEKYVFSEGDDNLRLTYVYGYTTVPAALVRAICLIAQAYSGTELRDSNIKSQSDGEQSVSYFDSPKTSVPIEAEALLDVFVRYASG